MLYACAGGMGWGDIGGIGILGDWDGKGKEGGSSDCVGYGMGGRNEGRRWLGRGQERDGCVGMEVVSYR